MRRQLREALGPEIKGLQRAVALEIADDARYDDAWKFDAAQGRRSKVRLSDLVRWTGAKDELSVREMLRRLAVAGWEFRLPIGKGKDGRPLYAVPGVAMQFRVPDFEGPTTVGPCGSEGPTVVEQGPTTVGEGPTVVAEGPTVVGPPSPPLLPASPKTSPSSSPSGASPPVVVAAPTDGGGGGASFDQDPDQGASLADPSAEQQQAEALVAALDYRGKAPRPNQLATIRRLAVAALEAGWTEQELKECLDLRGDPNVRDAAALYAHRLKSEELPDLQAHRKAASRPLEGTDAAVDGWMALSRQIGSHKPYKDDTWARLDRDAKEGRQPAGWETVPWCGNCDEITRTYEETEDGLPVLRYCTRCHPAMRF
ncbi:hypothetical protein [Streptomyces sp. NPDC088258]|uniref:hypothetical protein n=1 Tax=Streptomyces sp. NPDC088258 TaxID=3365849 RepID=UPI003828A730